MMVGFALGAFSQSFTDQTSLLGASYNSGGVVGVVDMDQDGYDDVLIFDNSRMIYVAYQESDGTFTTENYGSISGAAQWGGTAGDVDNNGHNDIFSGGSFDGTHYMNIVERGNASLTGLDEGQLFMQGINLVDMNNDGWLDGFGCDDVAESNIWGNDGAGNLIPQNDWIDMTTTPVSDNSGNYGSVWCDFDNDGDIDLFIAKCRQGVNDPLDPRRINALFVNDGNGNFTEEAAERGLVIYEQSWTSDFADIDNDGDFDCFLTNHSGTLRMLENDGQGYFTDITEGSGLDYSGFFLQGKLSDFDNSVKLLMPWKYGFQLSLWRCPKIVKSLHGSIAPPYLGYRLPYIFLATFPRLHLFFGRALGKDIQTRESCGTIVDQGFQIGGCPDFSPFVEFVQIFGSEHWKIDRL